MRITPRVRLPFMRLWGRADGQSYSPSGWDVLVAAVGLESAVWFLTRWRA